MSKGLESAAVQKIVPVIILVSGIRLCTESGCRKCNEDTLREVRFSVSKKHWPVYIFLLWTQQKTTFSAITAFVQLGVEACIGHEVPRLQNIKFMASQSETDETRLFLLSWSWKEDEWEWESRNKGTVTHSSAVGLLRPELDTSDLSCASKATHGSSESWERLQGQRTHLNRWLWLRLDGVDMRVASVSKRNREKFHFRWICSQKPRGIVNVKVLVWGGTP